MCCHNNHPLTKVIVKRDDVPIKCTVCWETTSYPDFTYACDECGFNRCHLHAMNHVVVIPPPPPPGVCGLWIDEKHWLLVGRPMPFILTAAVVLFLLYPTMMDFTLKLDVRIEPRKGTHIHCARKQQGTCPTVIAEPILLYHSKG
eukprot:gene1947-12939_t